MTVEQSEDTTLVNAVTAIVHAADVHFQRVGGSSRHWVRDCFLPLLNSAGWEITKQCCPDCGGDLRGSFPKCIDCQVVDALKKGDAP